MKLRNPRPEEIEVIVENIVGATVGRRGVKVSLHIKEEAGEDILNDAVGTMDWTRKYHDGYCSVGIWDSKKSRFIEKESDSFENALRTWGLVKLDSNITLWEATGAATITDFGDCFDDFAVADIEFENGKIKSLLLDNVNTCQRVYTMGKPDPTEFTYDDKPVTDADIVALKEILKKEGVSEARVCARLLLDRITDISSEQFGTLLANLDEYK